MVRRGQTPDEDSQKENAGPAMPAGKVKAEKVKAEKEKGKVKEERRRESRRARVESGNEDEGEAEGEEEEEHVPNGDAQEGGEEDEDEDEDEGEEEDEEEVDGSPKGRKRARVNGDGESRPAKAEGSGSAKGKARVTTLPRDDDGFIPGSIVRVQLRNFVTYDWVEFRPGPYLNMILGPNGTGKSSIACAICLGLNWSPQVLGRANDLNAFVKLGTDNGHIELELKGPKGKPNLVIRRNLSARTNSSTFTLNGQSATGKEVSMRMVELNVQVGNLCSFLPQDKVSEFAQMSPQQLLRETQRAAGDENLTAWHDTLIGSGKELKGLRERMKGENDQLTTMKERNETLERDVERYIARRRIEQDIALLEVLLPVQEYREARTSYIDIKAQQRDLHAKVRVLMEKNKPAHEFKARLAAQYRDLQRVRDDKKNAAQKKFKAMGNKWTDSEKMEEEAESISTELNNIKKSEKDRLKKIRETEAAIAKLQHQLDNPPEIEDEAVIVAEMRKLSREKSDLGMRHDELQSRQGANADASGRENAIINSGKQQLKQLDDVNEQKLQNLRRWDRDTADTVIWLRQNRDKFKMEVFDPPVMCLTIPDKRYANAIESCFSAVQLKTFVAQCPEDLDTLNHYINDSTEGLNRKSRVSTWFRLRREDSLVPPPMSPEEMAQQGFDGYAINYVDCPEGMKWFLKMDLNFHRTAIALNGGKINVANAMQAVSQYGPNGTGGGATFVAGSTMNIVQRSRYGTKAPQNMTREVRPARNLINSTVDPEVRRKIQVTINEAQQRHDMFREEEEKLAKEELKYKEDEKVLHKRHNALLERKEAVKNATTRQHGLESRIQSSKDKIEQWKRAPSAEAQAAKLKKQLLDTTKKRVRLVKEYTGLIRGAIADQAAATRATLEFMQISANKSALEALCEQKDEQYQKALAEFEEVDQQFKVIKQDSKEKLERSRAVLDEADPETRAQYEEIEGVRQTWDKNGQTPPPEVEQRKSGELEVALGAKKNELELNKATNPGVIEQYEQRKKEIENLEKTLEEQEKNARKVEKAIKIARDNWQPALETLVGSIGQKFSAAFDRIGCAGEIRISEHEDYEKWAIDILVKFRDKEKLQLLTAQRQSGGERSLTTILYLMSLTEEARAPFSLVDEINQGMDKRAERAVHDSMVEVTCKASSAQYFLITPKLLPDLSYHERMKVLCVNNGEWLPEERDLGNMMNMIEAFVQRRKHTNPA